MIQILNRLTQSLMIQILNRLTQSPMIQIRNRLNQSLMIRNRLNHPIPSPMIQIRNRLNQSLMIRNRLNHPIPSLMIQILNRWNQTLMIPSLNHPNLTPMIQTLTTQTLTILILNLMNLSPMIQSQIPQNSQRCSQYLPSKQSDKGKKGSRGPKEIVSYDNSTTPLSQPASTHADRSQRDVDLPPARSTSGHTTGVGAYASLCLSFRANTITWLLQLGPVPVSVLSELHC